jgi:hypothetical protein
LLADQAEEQMKHTHLSAMIYMLLINL